MINIKIEKIDGNAIIPTIANEGDMGMDFYAHKDVIIPGQKQSVSHEFNAGVYGTKKHQIFIPVGLGREIIPTGIKMELPEGYGLFIKDRSSIAWKEGLFTTAGVIDNGYRGEIGIVIYNASGVNKMIKKGTKIAQGVLIPIPKVNMYEVESLSETKRGEKGYGSSDEKSI